MADQLYLSLWYPNFRLDSLPAALISVMRQFALVGGEKRVAAATAYPISWNESPIYQRIYVNDERSEDDDASLPENAVAEAMEQLHDDIAWEFELRWPLWSPEVGAGLDPVWKQQPSTVRIVGFGPEFDDASYEQNGHIRVDFGLDSPFLLEEVELDEIATKRVQQNIEMLVAFTLSVEKHCGISSRLLWTESGEPFAQKLIDRLQRLN
ncbi:MAG: hypothetical protein ACYC46_14545 [Acidobacteriaceae bacterium]